MFKAIAKKDALNYIINNIFNYLVTIRTLQIKVLQDRTGSDWTGSLLLYGTVLTDQDQNLFIKRKKNLQLGHGFANSTPTTT